MQHAYQLAAQDFLDVTLSVGERAFGKDNPRTILERSLRFLGLGD